MVVITSNVTVAVPSPPSEPTVVVVFGPFTVLVEVTVLPVAVFVILVVFVFTAAVLVQLVGGRVVVVVTAGLVDVLVLVTSWMPSNEEQNSVADSEDKTACADDACCLRAR